jgi:hypothetical protein
MDGKNLTARASDSHSTFVEFSMLLNSIYLSYLEALKGLSEQGPPSRRSEPVVACVFT